MDEQPEWVTPIPCCSQSEPGPDGRCENCGDVAPCPTCGGTVEKPRRWSDSWEGDGGPCTDPFHNRKPSDPLAHDPELRAEVEQVKADLNDRKPSERCEGTGLVETGDPVTHGSRITKLPCPGCEDCKPSDSPTEERIAVWPCDHGNVVVEPGPAKPGYPCHTCGAVATTYVPASQALQAEVERLRELVVPAEEVLGLEVAQDAYDLHSPFYRLRRAVAALSPQPEERKG